MSDTWVEHTTAFDRVKSVSLTLSEPRTTGWIAAEAKVSENTARSHLSQLADLGVLSTTATEKGVAYVPDPIYTRSQDLRELVTANSEEQLATTAVDIQEDLEAYRSAYGVDTPRALRATVAAENCSPEEARSRLETASDWEYAAYRLSLVRDALEHYDTYTSSRPASA